LDKLERVILVIYTQFFTLQQEVTKRFHHSLIALEASLSFTCNNVFRISYFCRCEQATFAAKPLVPKFIFSKDGPFNETMGITLTMFKRLGYIRQM